MPRGYALILCHEKFKNHSSLPGVRKDESALKNTFQSLNIRTRVLRNGRKDTIRQKIDELSCRDFSSEKYFIISILSHGGENNVICAQDGEYNLIDFIVTPICENPTLAGKPKIFLVDACKGSKAMSRGNGLSDVFVFYATTEGYVSYESRKHGGYFTHYLCRDIERYGEFTTFREIVDEVTKDVYKKTCAENHPQQPTCIDLLRRDFYF